MIHAESSSQSPSIGQSPLPVHFFTIVLNGEPFIRYHLGKFTILPFDWHWHIVEGVAALKYDTAWSVAAGGQIVEEFHHNGLSCDGTTEYLDEISLLYPDQITIYRKKDGDIWDGKLEMVNAPLTALKEECLLWQVDTDELWTVEQMQRVRRFFLDYPNKTAAFFYCKYFVGQNLLITNRGSYGNNPAYEWLRCWRYAPGDRWLSHEPPRLCRKDEKGSWVDLAGIDPLSHADTETYGLCFQHFAYVTFAQLRFKEVYYGYRGAVSRWEALQAFSQYPVRLKDFFQWASDETIVNTAESQKVKPLAYRDFNGRWRFLDCSEIDPLPVYNSLEIFIIKSNFRLVNFIINIKNTVKNKIFSKLIMRRLW
jgi:hypothetical protein